HSRVSGNPGAAVCSPWVPAISAFTRVFDALCAGTNGWGLSLRLEVDRGAGNEAQQDHHHAHDHHDAAGAVGADELRPVEHLGLVEHAEKLGGVGDGDGPGVAAEPAQAGARAFEEGAELGDGAVPPRQAPQTRQEEPAIKSDCDGREDQTYEHVVHSFKSSLRPNSVSSLSPLAGRGSGGGATSRIRCVERPSPAPSCGLAIAPSPRKRGEGTRGDAVMRGDSE